MDEDRIAALRQEIRLIRTAEEKDRVIERFLREGLGQSQERAFSLSGDAVLDGERLYRSKELRSMQREAFA